MAITFGTGGGNNNERAEDGTYMSRLIGIVDLRLQPAGQYTVGGKTQEIKAGNKLALVYELTTTLDENGIPLQQFETPNNILGEKATMTKRMMSMDPSGIKTDSHRNPLGLLGTACMVGVGSTSGGNAKVASVTAAPNGIPVAAATLTPYVFDWDEPNMETYDKLPGLIKYKLHQAVEFKDSPLHLAMLLGGYEDPLNKEEKETSY